MKFFEARLEWDADGMLYRVRGKRRDFVGAVMRNQPLSDRDGWTIWIGGEKVAASIPTIEEAKAILERYA